MDNISENTNVKRMSVTKRGNKSYYYPSSIPRARASMSWPYIGCILLILAVHFVLTANKQSFLCLYVFSFLMYAVYNFIYRCLLLICEFKHSQSRYGGDYLLIAKAAFTFNNSATIAFIISVLYMVYYISAHGAPSLHNDYWYITGCVLFMLHKLLDTDSNPIKNSLDITKGNGLDYGAGMAYSFFYGYLNYILPKTGDLMKNLEEMMQDYEAANNIKFEFYKIFILIPKSLTCHVEISSVSKLMELRRSLDDKVITVAGVRDRVYKNSVYSIKHDKTEKTVFVCTEYATPIKTFKEVYKNSTPHTEYYTRHKNDILLQFYLTLKEILEYEGLDKACELVYYDDVDRNNKYYDVGRILLSRIVDLKKYPS